MVRHIRRGYDGLDENPNVVRWSIPAALMYCITIYTTIGNASHFSSALARDLSALSKAARGPGAGGDTGIDIFHSERSEGRLWRNVLRHKFVPLYERLAIACLYDRPVQFSAAVFSVATHAGGPSIGSVRQSFSSVLASRRFKQGRSRGES